MSNKESLIYQTEANLKRLSDYGFKLLYTTHGFRLLGIVTWDKKRLDESLGERRRWVKGLKVEDGTPISPEESIFETSLQRKNPKSGELEDIVVHEDDYTILMERKTFDLSDEEDNFQFMPNMHFMNRVQQLMDDVEAGNRRLARLSEEKDQAVLDSEHFRREAIASKERDKTQRELLNRLTREAAVLQEKVGNLESAYNQARAKNLEYEATMDEITGNAQEKGTVTGMTTNDQVIHAAEKQKEINVAMHEIEPESTGISDQLQKLFGEIDKINDRLDEFELAKTQTDGAPTEGKTT